MKKILENNTQRVEVERINKYYFFKTTEKCRICPKCKTEYKTSKMCRQCWKNKKLKILTIEHIKEQEGKISLDLKEYNCTCLFGSFFRWAGYWRTVRPESVCKHFKLALKVIKSGK